MNRKEKRRIRRKKLKRIFTYANILSFSRILMAVPLVMALDGRLFDESIRNWACFGIILVIFLSDVLDGPLARWTDQVTNLGKIMDPVADKICMLVVLIFLIQDIMDPITVIGMEIIIIIGFQTITMITTRKRKGIGTAAELNQIEKQLYVLLPRIQKTLRML